MTSPPDKLFRDGLGEYQKPAPSSAWDRIETNLDRKQPKTPWMIIRIAAGIILVMALTISLWPDHETEAEIASTEIENVDPTANTDPYAIQAPETITEREAPAPPSTGQVVSTPTSQSKTKTQNNIPSSPIAKTELAVTKEVIPTKTESEVKVIHVEPVVATTETNNPALDIEIAETKRVSITYSAEQVNARFLKKDLPTKATSEKKNTSGVMKVIDTALDFKNDASLISELRERKNDLLTFNLPNKTRDTDK